MGLLGLVMGWLTDKLGPRFVVSFFGSFLGIGCLLLSRVTALWQFTVVHALIVCLGASTASVPIMATVSRWFVKRRGMMSGIVQSGLGIGGFIISPLTGWLISCYGWRTAYVAQAIFALVGIIMSGLFLGRDPRDMGLLSDGAKDGAAIIKRPGAGLTEPALTLKQIISSKQFWVIAGLYFAFGFCRSTFAIHLAPHVQDLGFSLAEAANVLAIINVSSIVGRIGMGRAADVMGMRFAID